MRPKARLAAQRVPKFKQKTSAGVYYDGAALDGSRPGTCYANLYDVKATPKFGMRTLTTRALRGTTLRLALRRR